MKDALTALLKVKSLFSITCMVILIASLALPVEPWVQEIVKVVVIFYFGTQAGKQETPKK